MKQNREFLKSMYQTDATRRVDALKRRIQITKRNMEVSSEIIAETQSDAQSKQLREKNARRKHAIGSLQKAVRDAEHRIGERSREVST